VSQHVTELVTLRDGAQVTLRAATPADEPALRSFLHGLSEEARRLRFFSGAADIDSAAHWAAATGPGRSGLIARDAMGALVAHAAYVKLESPPGEAIRAEVALEVADHLRDRGLATILLERLAALAHAHGISLFVAEVLPENRAMLDVFRLGFDARLTLHNGTDSVEFPTSAGRLARERFCE
jgi:acetate---CoA ligase (ADP-forming)